MISQSGVCFPYSERITAKNIYVHFHGSAEFHTSSYSDEMLIEFAGKFKTWLKEGHEIWIYFNNDIHGHAFRCTTIKRNNAGIKKPAIMVVF